MTDHRPTTAEVIDKLTALGSADQIARHFETEGIVFVGGSRSFGCPVSQYVQRETGTLVVATSRFVRPCNVGVFLDVSSDVRLDPEGPVSQFIQRFDAGGYPELEKAVGSPFLAV